MKRKQKIEAERNVIIFICFKGQLLTASVTRNRKQGNAGIIRLKNFYLSFYLDPCVYKDTEYHDGNIKKHKDVQDWRTCSNLCMQNIQCKGWSFKTSTYHVHDHRKICQLKNADYEKGRKSSKGVISGEKMCGGLSYVNWGESISEISNFPTHLN